MMLISKLKNTYENELPTLTLQERKNSELDFDSFWSWDGITVKQISK